VFMDRDPAVITNDHNDPHSEDPGMMMTSYDEVMSMPSDEDDRWRDVGDEKGAVVTVNKPVEAPGHGDIKPRQGLFQMSSLLIASTSWRDSIGKSPRFFAVVLFGSNPPPFGRKMTCIFLAPSQARSFG
jgi:hypothetical protein